MTRTFALLVCLGAVLPAAAAPRSEQDKKVDEAVARALKFLKSQQDPDGAWKMNGKDPAITSLAVMAFLSAGHVPGEGPYGATVEKGVRWVLKGQRGNGLFGSIGQYEMYQHGICTLMLAEVAGMTADKSLAQEIRDKLVKAVTLILRAQRRPNHGVHRGGWRYRIGSTDSDMSVTGWQLMALRAAKNVGCDVPADSIDRAVDYVKRSQDRSTGGFCYMAQGRGVTVPCTGTGILALELCGKSFHHSPECRRAGAYLLKHSLAGGRKAHFFYGVYYCSQAMFQLGGNYWAAYKPQLHKVLLSRAQGNGAWVGNHGASYSTAMAVLALTVEYRFLPIYQRDEQADKAN